MGSQEQGSGTPSTGSRPNRLREWLCDRSSALREPPWRIPATTAVGLAGFLLAVTVFIRGDLRTIGTLLAFGDEQKAAVLLLVLAIGIEGALWAVGVLALAGWYCALLSSWQDPVRELAVGCGVPFVLLGGAALFYWFFITWGGPWPPEEIGEFGISFLIGPLAFVIALVSVTGMFATAQRASGLYKQLPKGHDVPAMADVWPCFPERQAPAGTDPETPETAREEQHDLLSLGRALLHAYAGPIPSSACKLKQWFEAREHAKALLELKAYSLPAAAELLAILAPMIGAVVPALLSGA